MAIIKFKIKTRPCQQRLVVMIFVPDRILLLVFFLAMTIASLVILTSSPHLKLDWDVCYCLVSVSQGFLLHWRWLCDCCLFRLLLWDWTINIFTRYPGIKLSQTAFLIKNYEWNRKSFHIQTFSEWHLYYTNLFRLFDVDLGRNYK